MASPNKRSQQDEGSVGVDSSIKRERNEESVGMASLNKRSRRDEESLGTQDNSEENRENSNSGTAQETSIAIFVTPVSSSLDGEDCVTDIDVTKNLEKDIVPVSTPKVPYRTVQQSSVYHGVTRNRVTGRFEAGLWDKTHQKEGQTRKGRQVYLGGYDSEEKAARAYDLAALKYWGTSATRLNFPISNYEKELEEMEHMTKDEYVSSIKRQSSCFSKGTSIYRGVTRHKKEGSKWQARIGRLTGTRELHLGSFDTEEEAAIAYDIAAVELRGLKAVTNFHISNYVKGDRQITEEFSKLKEIAQASKKQKSSPTEPKQIAQA